MRDFCDWRKKAILIIVPELLDPKDFIISRKRKKYRFALFANSPLCFEYDEWDRTFRPDVLEIGAGNGRFAVELATRYPDQNFVAIDVKGDRLQNGARLAQERRLVNVRFIRARADQIAELFDAKTLSTIWLTFSDPFPKRRSAGRRMTHPTFLTLYGRLLSPKGSLCIKHDNPAFFAWSLEQLVREKWHIDALCFDLHEAPAGYFDDAKVLTTYESRWHAEGRITQFVKAVQFDED